MSLEPKPRSMAAVTITVNRKGIATALRPLQNLAICWNIRVSPSTSLVEVTICGVRIISRKGRVSASKLDVESSETIRQTSSGYAQEER